jgi:hypothetical protein
MHDNELSYNMHLPIGEEEISFGNNFHQQFYYDSMINSSNGFVHCQPFLPDTNTNTIIQSNNPQCNQFLPINVNDSCCNQINVCDPCGPINICDPCDPCNVPHPTQTINIAIDNINPLANVTNINQPNGVVNNNAKIYWAAKIGGINDDSGTSITTDANNNVIVVGYFRAATSSSSDIIPEFPTIAYNADGSAGASLISQGELDAMIVKYNSIGTVIWAAKIGGTSNDVALGVAVDINNNIIVTGTYMSVDLKVFNANNTIAVTLPAPSVIASFIVKYDQNGNVLWANAILSDNIIGATAVATDITSNIFVTGYYNGSINSFINPNNSTGATLPPSMADDVFVVKYNSSGFVQWATKIGDVTPMPTNVGSDRGLSIAISPDGSIVVTGFYNANPLVMYNAPNGSIVSSLTLTNTSGGTTTSDAFIVKYSTAGTAIWATNIGGINNDAGLSVAIDNASNIVVTGQYASPSLFVNNTPNGTTTGFTLTNTGSADVFVVKYSSLGIAIWATRIAGVSDESGNGVALDLNNNIVVTGFYDSNPLTIYNADGSIGPTLNNYGSSDAFLVKYNSSGNTLWATKQAGSSIDVGLATATDNNKSILATGYYYSTPLNIYNSDGTVGTSLANSGLSDAYIVKYVDYGQILTLLPSLCPQRTKTIILTGYNGINTLIIAPDGLLVDSSGKPVKGILLTDLGATVSMIWCNNRWIIQATQSGIILYI